MGFQGKKGQGVGRSAEGIGKQSNSLPSFSLCTLHLCWGKRGQGSPFIPSTPDTMPEPQLTVRSLDTKHFRFVVS